MGSISIDTVLLGILGAALIYVCYILFVRASAACLLRLYGGRELERAGEWEQLFRSDGTNGYYA